MNTLRPMLRMLARDLRAGELTVLFVALALAVAALTSVGFLADRVERALEREAHQLLGGDLMLSADYPWPDAFRAAARTQGVRLAESANLVSMVGGSAGQGEVQLTEIKAVSDGYPLRGALRIAPGRKLGDGATAAIPPPGTAWPDERLADLLGADVGASLQVGDLSVGVAAILTHEPDRGINPFAIAPRLLVNLADLPATGLIQPGSRIRWRLHAAGEAADVARFRQWAAAHLPQGAKLEGLDNARPEVRNVVERAQRFLRLAALLTVVLAAVAVGMTARRYMQRHLDACAVMRCLGASERQIVLIHGGEFVVLGLAAAAVGALLGYAAQAALHGLLAGLVAAALPPPGPLPWLHGLAVAMLLVVGFVVPPLLRLKSAPTVRVLRREWGGVEPLSAASYLSGVAGLAGAMFWIAGDLRLGGVVLGGFALAIAVFALAGKVLLALATRGAARFAAGGWRLGLASLSRRSDAALVQIVALALGLTAMLLLTLARTDLLAAWQGKMPPDAPNRFVVNIQPEQRADLEAFFSRAGLTPPRLEPMIRGRLTAVNGKAVASADYPDDRARRLVEREFNLSARNDLPEGNAVVAGRWHRAGAVLEFSVEKGLADTLGLKLGDALTYLVAGQNFSGRIASLRKLNWDSMRVNFFVIAPEGTLDDLPVSYITSFYLPTERAALAGDLVRAMPNLTVIDVAALVRQLQATLDQAARAVQLVFLFALGAGLAVLYAAIEAGSGERNHELAVLRALGARRVQLRQALLAEFAVLGLLAGLLAGLGAGAIGAALARWVFQLDYLPSAAYLAVGVAAGLVGVGVAGLSAARRAFSGRVAERLRSA